MIMGGVNIWLWLALIPSYFLYEYVGTINTIATANLKAVKASNTSVMMYLIGLLGTYLCITEGLINMVPILIGSWFGTYYSVKHEIKLVKYGRSCSSNAACAQGVVRVVQKKESRLWRFFCRLRCSWRACTHVR